MNYIAMIITQNLKFDMVRFFHKLLQINSIISKRRHGFRTGSIISFHYLIFIMNKTHTLSAAAH